MKCLNCKHIHENDDPGGGSWTGPGSQSVSCGLGKWYIGNNECLIVDLRKAVETAALCQDFVPGGEGK